MRRFLRGLIAIGLAGVCLMPLNTMADTLPSGERAHGNVTIEPAYNDVDGSIIYLQTPNTHAPLNPTNPTVNVNARATAPLYLIVYPAGTAGIFNCMGVPGNCPDHGGVIAGVATSQEPAVYGTNPALVPGHDHLVGGHGSDGYNTAWHVYVELFTPGSTVTHITTLAQLQHAWDTKSLMQLDTGIVFLCGIVSEKDYLQSTPVA